MPRENAVHEGAGHGHLMKAPQIVRNPAGPEVIRLAQIEDLAHDVTRNRARRAMRRPCSGLEISHVRGRQL